MHATGRAPPPAPPPAPPGGAGEADPEAGAERPSFFSARGTRAGAARRGPRMRRLAGWVADAARPAPAPAAAAAAAVAAGRAELLPLCRRMQVLRCPTLVAPRLVVGAFGCDPCQELRTARCSRCDPHHAYG